jgi:hypothetical protein
VRTGTRTPGVSRESLIADLVNLQARNERMAQTRAALEQRLSEAFGEAIWKASGLGAPLDMEALHQRIRDLEQTTPPCASNWKSVRKSSRRPGQITGT